MPQELVFRLTVPAWLKSLRIGSLGLVTSFENDISMYVSDDGKNYSYGYSHKAGLAPNYQEIGYSPKGKRLFIKIQGFRRDKLFKNDLNYVSLSHLFVFKDQ